MIINSIFINILSYDKIIIFGLHLDYIWITFGLHFVAKVANKKTYIFVIQNHYKYKILYKYLTLYNILDYILDYIL